MNEKASVASLIIGGILLPLGLATKYIFEICIPFITEVATQVKIDAPAPHTQLDDQVSTNPH